jgi:hypothetical protein
MKAGQVGTLGLKKEGGGKLPRYPFCILHTRLRVKEASDPELTMGTGKGKQLQINLPSLVEGLERSSLPRWKTSRN